MHILIENAFNALIYLQTIIYKYFMTYSDFFLLYFENVFYFNLFM